MNRMNRMKIYESRDELGLVIFERSSIVKQMGSDIELI